MTGNLELFGDDDGLLIVGAGAEIDRFLAEMSLPSQPVDARRVGTVLGAGAAIGETLATAAANSGHWVKLTKESAEAVRRFGLMETGTNGVRHAMIGKPGEIKQWIQIVSSPSSLASNPALLSGAAGIMAQVALRQLVNEITEYLDSIDQKVDAVLRNQTNQVLARVDGVELLLLEATSVREAVGRVSEVTWSKVQQSSATILETQAFALRQLNDIAERLERLTKVDDLVDVASQAEAEVRDWLQVLARCVRVHDSVAAIELDRVMDASPNELDQHLAGLRAARQRRLESFAEATFRILVRADEAIARANAKVLLNPMNSPAVVASCNRVAASVQRFQSLMSIESDREASEARGWRAAASEQWGVIREASSEGVDTVQRAGAETLRQARSAKERLASKFSQRGLPLPRRDSGGSDA